MRYPNGSIMVYFGEKIHLEMDEKWMRNDGSSPISGNPNWLVVGPPLWKIWVNWDDDMTPRFLGKCQIHGNHSPPSSLYVWWLGDGANRIDRDPRMTQGWHPLELSISSSIWARIRCPRGIWGFPKIWLAQVRWMLFVRGNPIVRNGGWWLGYPHFRKPPLNWTFDMEVN